MGTVSRIVAPLLCGLIFGTGLLISGMVQPTKVLGFLVGQVMKATGGKASPKLVNELVRRALDRG